MHYGEIMHALECPSSQSEMSIKQCHGTNFLIHSVLEDMQSLIVLYHVFNTKAVLDWGRSVNNIDFLCFHYRIHQILISDLRYLNDLIKSIAFKLGMVTFKSFGDHSDILQCFQKVFRPLDFQNFVTPYSKMD